MDTLQKPLPPEDVIVEDSGPSVTDAEPPPVEIDVDDAQIEEPRDDVFEKKF
jgi:hypothetical protein